ncbi:MAG: SDR family oxidoreductase [Bacteroidia bacterium]
MKTIVVTGATKGIGKAICQKFAKENFNIALCSRNSNELKKLAIELSSLGANKVVFLSTDVSKKQELKQFAEKITDEFETVDILVNNAGVFVPGKITEEEEGMLELMVETNVYSAYYLTRFLLPHIEKSDSAHIVNMCSIASQTAYDNGGSYSISKFAMLGMSKVLREELKPKNIKVTALMPGATYTASWEGVDIPQSRFMQSNEIADLVWAAYSLLGNAVVEEMVIRPQLGDL